MAALADTIRRFHIPPEPFLDLLSAFEQDQRVKRYDTFDQLLDYCRRSADPVGRLVLYLFECHDEERGRLSDDVCTGLQLANFWQDVARDFAKGRVYIPAEDMTRFGVTTDQLAERRCTPAFADLMRFEVDRTAEFFRRGRALLPLLPPVAKIDIDLFIRGGEATLDAIRGCGYDVLSRRPTVSRMKKVMLLVRAVCALLR
jgi:squalene synthase HpnC